MLRLIDLRESSADPRSVVPRAAMDLTEAGDVIRPVLEDVRVRGADAVLDACERFDSVRPDQLRVPASVIADALAGLDPSVRRALEVSIERARRVHQDQRRVDVETEVVPGGTVTERWLPVSRVGLYVPGGRAVYPSSVVMNVIPAQEAGVPSLACRQSSSKGRRRVAPPHGPGRVLAAGSRGDLRGGRRPGGRDAGLRHRPSRR